MISFGQPVCSMAKNSKTVILSFDDGPHPGTTEKILEILNEHKVPGTFFLVGKMIEKYPYLVRKIYASGGEIGNHTYSDIRLTELSKEEIKHALNTVSYLLEEIVGKKTRFFRPPGGRLNRKVLNIAHIEGYNAVLWTRYVGDTSKGITSMKIFKRATWNPERIELIMMHDGPRETIRALPRIIRFYQRRGYKFTTVSGITPPLFNNYHITKKTNLSDWPIALWDSENKELNSQQRDIPKKVAGIMALFAWVGSTVFFVRLSGNKRYKKKPVSIVFLGMKKKYIESLFNILDEKNIKGTFFLTEDHVEELNSFENKKIQPHNIAYLKKSDSVKIKEDLIRWKDKLGVLKSTAVPLCYSANGYSAEEIKDLKEVGYLPIEWKIAPPKKNINTPARLIKYFMKRLQTQKVIPVWGDRKCTIKALPDLITGISKKGYSFFSLNDYVVEKFLS